MVRYYEYEHQLIWGWMVEIDDLAEVYLKEKGKEEDSDFDDVSEEFTNWCEDNGLTSPLFKNHDDSHVFLGKVIGALKPAVAWKVDTIEELMSSIRQYKANAKELKSQVTDMEFFKKHPELFENEPREYIHHSDCICCN